MIILVPLCVNKRAADIPYKACWVRDRREDHTWTAIRKAWGGARPPRPAKQPGGRLTTDCPPPGNINVNGTQILTPWRQPGSRACRVDLGPGRGVDRFG